MSACWIRRTKRLAIYLRDGFCCMYCGQGAEQGANLTLDHIKPVSKGGTNDESNLLTCCMRCNQSRGRRSIRIFARDLAVYIGHGINENTILKAIRRNVRLPLKPYKKEAKLLIERRGVAAQERMRLWT